MVVETRRVPDPGSRRVRPDAARPIPHTPTIQLIPEDDRSYPKLAAKPGHRHPHNLPEHDDRHLTRLDRLGQRTRIDPQQPGGLSPRHRPGPGKFHLSGLNPNSFVHAPTVCGTTPKATPDRGKTRAQPTHDTPATTRFPRKTAKTTPTQPHTPAGIIPAGVHRHIDAFIDVEKHFSLPWRDFHGRVDRYGGA